MSAGHDDRLPQRRGAPDRAPQRREDKPDLELWIRDTVAGYQKRAKRLYRMSMGLRAIILLCAFLAVLPDSALFRAPEISQAYGAITSVAGAVGALIFILATNLRIVETISTLNELVAYLEDQSIKLIAKDGLSRQIVEREIRKEIAAKEAALQTGVFAGLDKYFGNWGNNQGG